MDNTFDTNSASSDEQDILQQFSHILNDFWRFRWMVIITTWIVALLGWSIIALLPYKYEASTRVFVDTDSVLRPLLKGLAIESRVEDKLGIMTRTLLSRPNLEKVMRKTDMDHQANNKKDTEKLLKKLHESIEVTSARRENLYTIKYSNKDPAQAKAVVQSLLNIFVESSLGDSRQDSDVAEKFIEQQIKDYESKLVVAEQRLMEFKRKHLGMLPGQGVDYFARLQKAQSALEQANFELDQARHKEMALEKQSKELLLAARQSTTEKNQLTLSIDKRIDALQEKLDNLLLRYTAEHPDVKEIKQTLASLHQQKEAELKALANSDSGNDVLASNPLYHEMNLAMGQASANVAAAKVRVNEYKKRVAKLQELVGVLPKIEAELASLNRDYSINKKHYDTLISRRESARMSKEAESAGDNVKFQIIDPPFVPSTPASPNKPVLNTIVLIFSIAIGLAVAYFWGQLKQVVYDVRTLSLLVNIPVLGSVSEFKTEEDKKLHNKQILSISIASGVLLVIYSSIMALVIFR